MFLVIKPERFGSIGVKIRLIVLSKKLLDERLTNKLSKLQLFIYVCSFSIHHLGIVSMFELIEAILFDFLKHFDSTERNEGKVCPYLGIFVIERSNLNIADEVAQKFQDRLKL